MTQHRKHTAWKKSRKFGDIHGGRMRVKCPEGVFNRKHNLQPPGQETPIFIIENTSRDFYFPVTAGEIRDTINKLPTEHTKFLTHIWLAKLNKKEYLRGETPQGEFICGSKVYLIKLYAFPADNKMLFGQVKPAGKQLNFYKPYCGNLQYGNNGWYLQWTAESIKKYYLHKLLLHEIGHCADYFYGRYWSKANVKQREDFADNYAVTWSNHFKEVIQE
jgi:hypothetical protein